ncbi:MAG: hypothetical protein ACE5NN_03280 [Candidatus Bathyarchaeia archaeon]
MKLLCGDCGGDLTPCELCGGYHHTNDYEREHQGGISFDLDGNRQGEVVDEASASLGEKCSKKEPFS